jgi:hypothetical protein
LLTVEEASDEIEHNEDHVLGQNDEQAVHIDHFSRASPWDDLHV